MAVTDKKPIRSAASMKKAINYIINDRKTNGGELVTYFDCNKDIAGDQMEFTRCKSKVKLKRENEIYGWSMYQSFSSEDNITPKEAHEIGLKMMEQYLGGKHQFVIATHVDTEHIHNQIVFNAVSHKDFKRHRSDKNKSIERLQNISDKICTEHGLSVVIKEDHQNKRRTKAISYKEHQERKKGTSWKAMLQDDIDKNIKRSNSYEEFLMHMKKSGYSYKESKHLAFICEVKGQKRPTRTKTIGAEYTEDRIKERILNKEHEFSNNENTRENRIFNNKKRNSFNYRDYYKYERDIKYYINSSIRKANSIEDVFEMLMLKGYEIKKENNGYKISKNNIDIKINFKRISERIEYLNSNKEMLDINNLINLNKVEKKYKRWATIRNTEEILKTTQYLLNNGYTVESFDKEYNNAIKDALLIDNRIKDINETISSYKQAIDSLKTLNSNRFTYNKYLEKNKDSEFYYKNKLDIESYIKSENKLEELGISKEKSINDLYKRIDELNDEKTLIYDEKYINQNKVKNINKICENLYDIIDR